MIASNDPEGIRADMARTRAEMSVTIDALQERLEPQRLKEQANEKIRAATIGKLEEKTGDFMNNIQDIASETRHGIADTIRKNPIPAALVGVGLAAMFFNGSDKYDRGYRPSGRYGTDARAIGRPIYGGMRATPVRNSSLGGDSAQGTAQNVADQAKATVKQVGEDAQQLGRQAQDQVENLTGQVKETVQQLGSQAQDQIEEFSGNVQDQMEGLTAEVIVQAKRLSGSFDRILRENPLALGVLAIGIGGAVAMITPQTPQEDQIFGEARDQVLQKAETAAHDALDQVAEQAQKLVSPAAG